MYHTKCLKLEIELLLLKHMCYNIDITNLKYTKEYSRELKLKRILKK